MTQPISSPTAAGVQAVAPASVNQRRLVFLQGLHPDSSFYNVAVQIAIDGELDSERLIAALHQVVVHHEALRTGFGAAADGALVQIIHPDGRSDVLRFPTGRLLAHELRRPPECRST